MKNILLGLLLIFFIFNTNAQLRESVIIETDIFTVEYSEILEQPLRVEYTILCPNGNINRSGMGFYKVNNVHTSDDNDYINNVWDKGHLAPAASFNCNKKLLAKTFSYLNSALQHKSLNRGVWSRLEAFERNLANFYTVKVKIEVLFDENSKIISSGATVPSGFKKTIQWDNKVEVFLFPNANATGTNWLDYHITK